MQSERINWLAVLVTVIVQQILSFFWYGVFFAESWMRLLGRDLADFEGAGSWAPYALSFAAAFLLAYFLARILARGTADDWTPGAGLRWAFMLWLCVLLPFIATHHAFTLLPWGLTMIDAGKELVGLLISGAVLGAWGPKG